VSVNLSARQFQDVHLIDNIAQILAETGLPSDGLRLEVTESVAIRNMELSIRVMNMLEEMGVRCSLDDFGTGYSSLSYLKQFPLKVLKIDRSFIQDIQLDKKNEGLIAAIIAMARSLDMEVVAEGVEREEQRSFLRSQLCDHMQGYLIGHPVPDAEFKKLIK
jgi:EAL domain-containing protein (putative c-di-GMP-specific phosphodiesterase class I)